MLASRTTLLGLLTSMMLPSGPIFANDSGPSIYKSEAPGVVRIRAIGTKTDGTMDGADGTGFVISSDGYVLTASHVIPEKENLATLIIGGYLGPETGVAKPYPLELVSRSDSYDAALLKMTKTPPQLTTLPLRRSVVSVGEQLFVLGYPLGLPDTHFLDGRVGAVADDALTTNALVDKGNSGGPVVDVNGCVIGIVFGGITTQDGMPVNGMKFAVPITSITSLIPHGLAGRGSMLPPSHEADIIHVTDILSRMQTDHALLQDTVTSYHDTIAARRGYLIESVESVGHNSLAPASLNFPVPIVAPDGRSMTFDYALDSGPLFNQTRSWIDMVINTKQSLIGAAVSSSFPSCP